jgi:hypothetical protein
MTTNEERVMILRMVEQGKISAEEGARLMAAVNRSEEEAPTPPDSTAGTGNARFLRVRVTDTVSGVQKVSVNIPTKLVTFALRFVPEIQGVSTQSIREAIDSGLTGRIVDVQDTEEGNRVEIFVE